MVNFSFEDWLINISTLGILLFGYGLGIYFFYKSRKLKINLLSLLSLSMISLSFGWLAVVIDFFSVLITSSNIDLFLFIYLTWVQLPFSVLLSQYVAIELLLPMKKLYLLSFLLILSFLFLIFLIINPINSVIIIGYPIKPFYYKAGLKIDSIVGVIGIVLMAFVLIFSGLGYIYKSHISNTSIKNNFRYLGMGMIFISSFGILDSIVEGYILVLVRIGAIFGLWLTYWGLKPRIFKKPTSYDEKMKLINYFLYKPTSTDLLGEIDYYSKLLKRQINIFMSFNPKDIKLFKIKEVATALKNYPEIKNILYWQHEMNENVFEFTENNIDKFDLMIIFCSKLALSSASIKNQWISAAENKKPIIPVYLNLDHIPPIIKQNEGLFYDLYDFNKNVQRLRYLILKTIFNK